MQLHLRRRVAPPGVARDKWYRHSRSSLKCEATSDVNRVYRPPARLLEQSLSPILNGFGDFDHGAGKIESRPAEINLSGLRQ
jgi:hypothetical protein